MSTNIEWTDETWNPIVGCSKVSEGCKNCYAIRMAWRLSHNPKMGDRYKGVVQKSPGGALNWTGKTNLLDEVLLKPAKVKKPKRWFVNSESDLFHESVPFEFIDKVFAVMGLCPQHTFQVLTKRPKRMKEYIDSRVQEPTYINDAAQEIAFVNPGLFFIHWSYRDSEDGKWQLLLTIELLKHLKDAGWYSGIYAVDKEIEFFYDGNFPFDNIWLGVSVENQKAANERIPVLITTPGGIRFLSCEPLLGPVDLEAIPIPRIEVKTEDKIIVSRKASFLSWVIVGGESGPGARPMHPDWVRGLRDQCSKAGVAFFFKQWGEYEPQLHLRVGKKKAGRHLDGRTHDEFPNP